MKMRSVRAILLPSIVLLIGSAGFSQMTAGMSGGGRAGHPSGIWFAVLGDSNGVGQSSTEAYPQVKASPGAYGHRPIAYTTIVAYTDPSYLSSVRGVWKLLNDPFLPNADPGSRSSPWPAMANAGITEIDKPINFVFGAYPSTGVIWKTLPGDTYPKIVKGGQQYEWMRARLAELPNIDLRAFLLIGCKRDVDQVIADRQATYQAAIDQLADDILSDYGVPLIVSIFESPEVAIATEVAQVKAATIAAAASNTNLFIGPDNSDLEWEADETHIKEVSTFGARWWNSVRSIGVTK